MMEGGEVVRRCMKKVVVVVVLARCNPTLTAPLNDELKSRHADKADMFDLREAEPCRTE
jgi:hypothetical protein